MGQQFDSESRPWYRSSMPVAAAPAVVVWEEPLHRYLADVRGALAGMSEAEKDAVVAEIRQHLLSSLQAYAELGDAPEQALQNALTAFGAIRTVGDALSETYQTTGTARRTFPKAAMGYALRVFGIAMALAAGIVLLSICLRQYAPQWAGTAPVVAYQYHCGWVIALLIPTLAGGIVGKAKASRAALGAFYALALLALASAPFTWPALTHFEDTEWHNLLALVPMFFVFWMPTATLAAHVSAAIHRHTRRLQRAR